MDDLTEMTFGMSVPQGGARVASMQTDYYRVLDISTNANRLEIREAYLRLKGTYGAGGAALYSLIDEEEAARQMAEIEEAFRTLNDDQLRREYDQRRGVERDARGDSFRQGAISAPLSTADSEHMMRVRDSSFSMRPSETGIMSSGMHGLEPRARPTLANVKLRANQAGTAEMQEKMQELIVSGDPGDGDLYRRLREVCGVTTDEIQERTKVSIGYIEAIETNRFERLPQVVYVKGFLASYFKYLDVPGYDKLVAAFAARLSDWQANKKN